MSSSGSWSAGRSISCFRKSKPTAGAELLRVERLSRAGEFEDISFALRRGEILGIYGLVGAGRTELAQVLFGINAADSGNITSQPRDIALVPEDRQTQGSILPFSIAANIALAQSRDAGAARLVPCRTRSATGATLDRTARRSRRRAPRSRCTISPAAISRRS